MYRVLLLVTNHHGQEVTINYGSHDDKFQAVRAVATAMDSEQPEWYRVDEVRIEFVK